MRYAILAAISASLLSTAALAQDTTSRNQHQQRFYAPRSYVPPAASSPAVTTFPQNLIERPYGTRSPSPSRGPPVPGAGRPLPRQRLIGLP